MEVITSEKIPLYVFTNIDTIEPDCLQQAKDTANLESAFHHVALMPDAHIGYGMPIGGVLALEGHICPNSVGVDIGCGMGFVPTDLEASSLTKENLQKLTGQIMRDVPTGFAKHKKARPAPQFLQDHKLPKELESEIGVALKSLGTLGGGNHFIDILKDQHGKVAIMLHSGSRHFGLAIAKYYHRKAQKQCEKRGTNIPNSNLAYLDIETKAGKGYIYAMDIALQFARENRKQLMDAAQKAVKQFFSQVRFGEQINAHHNYAALEQHFGKEVWVHRKGAIRAQKDEPVIVPGTMATHSYVGVGLGNPDSFNSCAHGAGRVMGRKEATRKFSVQEVLEDLDKRGIVLGKINKSNIAEESYLAYKNIEEVTEDQKTLARMDIELTPLAVVVG